MKKKKSNLDEMQEQELLKIEHNGCWLAFWLLLAAILVQIVAFPGDMKTVTAEWIIFMILCGYVGVACMRRGIWDRKIAPTGKNNVIASLIGGGGVAVISFLLPYFHTHEAMASLVIALLAGAVSFGLCLLALTLASRATQKRMKALEEESDEESDEE